MNYYTQLNQLTAYNFLFIADTCIHIVAEYQKNLEPAIELELYAANNFEIISNTTSDNPLHDDLSAFFYRKIDSLSFLKKLGVIIDYDWSGQNPEDIHPTARLEINISKLEELEHIITEIYHKKYASDHPITTKAGSFLDNIENHSPQAVAPMPPKEHEQHKNNESEILYEIKYTENGEIFLNNFLFTKVQVGGENEMVFRYLFKNPNKEITKKTFEKATGEQIGKTFYKIVENLGFSGNIRKVFFRVSERCILFRNPVKREDLNKLNIAPLKLQKKAII